MDSDSPMWSRRRYVLTSMSAVAASGLAGCSGGESQPEDDSGPDDSGNSSQTDDGNQTDSGDGDVAETASAVIGELVEGDQMELVVRSVERTTSLGEFQEADSGNTFVVLRLAIKNTSDEFANFSSHFQATLQNPDGVAYEPTFSVTDHPLQSGVLAAGEVARGDLVFEVPEDDSDLALVMDLSAFDVFEFSRVEVDLTQEAETKRDVEQTLGVDVNSVGDTVSHEDVSVILHGVRTETELGDYSQAEDNYEYVIPEIEVENGTDEDLQVSTLLQMDLKTEAGLSYSMSMDSSQLDQKFSEQQPIAPGQNRRGELAYEVEQDSGQRYWAYNFYEFSNPMKAFWRLE